MRQASVRACIEKLAHLLRKQGVAPQYLAVFRAGVEVLANLELIEFTHWSELSQLLDLQEVELNQQGTVQVATPLIGKAGVAFLIYAPIAEELESLEQRLVESATVTNLDNGTGVDTTPQDVEPPEQQAEMAKGLIELSAGFVLDRGPDR